MKTLRERIEALPECCGQVKLSEVLRIVAEHERDSAAASSALAEVSTKPNPFPLSHDDAFRLAVETNEDSH